MAIMGAPIASLNVQKWARLLSNSKRLLIGDGCGFQTMHSKPPIVRTC